MGAERNEQQVDERRDCGQRFIVALCCASVHRVHAYDECSSRVECCDVGALVEASRSKTEIANNNNNNEDESTKKKHKNGSHLRAHKQSIAPHHNSNWLSKCKQVAAAASALLLLLMLGATRQVCAQETSPELTAAATTTTTTPSYYSDNSTLLHTQSVHKLKPVNFTLVDELFDAALTDDELVRRWRQMDNQFQDGIKSILKLVFPQIVAISQDAKVSGECSGGILKWILSLRNLRSWAIKMLDATGKPSAGIFEGSLTMFGNYRQCLNIRAPDEDEIEITDQFEEYFRGQFCVLHLKPWLPIKRPYYHMNTSIEALLRRNYKYYEKTLYDELAEIAIAFQFIDIRMDLCVPSTCTLADIQRVADLLSRKLEMRAKVMRCDTQARDTSIVQNMDRPTALWLLFPVSIIVLVVLASVLRCICFKKRFAASKQSSLGGSVLFNLLDCISIQSSLRSLFEFPLRNDNTPNAPSHYYSNLNAHTNNGPKLDQNRSHQTNYQSPSSSSTGSTSSTNPDQTVIAADSKPMQLYGLRSIFVIWFMIIQMTVELKYQFLRESLTLRNMMLAYWPYQILINSTLVFESLIIITAFTFAYTNLESTFERLIGSIVRKYFRLTPSIVALIALTAFVPLLGIESPVWRNFVEQQAQVCKSTAFLDLFYLQNFVSYDKICLPHTWLFCVELQLMILSIPLIVLLKQAFLSCENTIILEQSDKISYSHSRCQFWHTLTQMLKSKAGLLCSSLIVFGCGVNFYSVYANQLPPSWFYTFPDVNQKNYYFGAHLTKTWTHLSAFFVGLFGGHLCRSTIKLNQTRLLKSESGCNNAINKSNSSSDIARSSACSNHDSNSSIVHTSGDDSSNYCTCCKQRGQQQSSSERPARDWQRTGVILVSLVCMFVIVFATHTWSTAQQLPAPLISALYDSISRLVWSVALVAITVLLCAPKDCADEQRTSGSAARLLGHPVLIALGRLSFLAYLLAPFVHTFILAVEEQLLFPSLFFIFHLIVGNIVIIYILALVLAVVIEQPIGQLISRFIFQIQKPVASLATRHTRHTQATYQLDEPNQTPNRR